MAIKFKPKETEKRRRYWQDQIKACEKGGLSQKEYCKQNNLCLSTLGNWKRRLRRDQVKRSSFVEIKPVKSEAEGSSAVMELVIGEEIILRIGEEINPEKLAQIIKSVSAVS